MSIFVSCNTAYYDQGREITDRGMILRKYKKTNIYYDTISLTSLIYYSF